MNKKTIEFNHDKLRGKIVEVFRTQTNFAKELGMTKASVSAKIKSNTALSQSDIFKMSKLLGLNQDEIGEYFFTELK